MKKISVLLLTLVLILNSFVTLANARTLGKDPYYSDPNKAFEEDNKLRIEKNDWMFSIPRVWTGLYDGNHGSTHVRRKYALKIIDIDIQTGDFTGAGFVDKYPDKKHPEMQVRLSYNLKGKLDYSKRSITFQGTTFIQEPKNYDFSFVRFDAIISDDLKNLSGTTTAWDGAIVQLTAATSSSYISNNSNEFNYNENKMEPYLAKELMEDSMLIYGESALDATGYYVKNKQKNKMTQLIKKLKAEGFPSNNIDTKIRISSKKSNDTKDCIHWAMAHKPLKDGTELVYIIVKGTTGNEWYGDFNVTGTDDKYHSEYEGLHYSFETSADALISDMLEKQNKLGINKVKYVVTGHSRGAAVANIVAKKLTDNKSNNSNIKGVYGYTFATPAVINLERSGNYTNIFNFCFDDDFVTYMPLSDANWQYSRYGTTYYSCAADLYKKSSYFRGIMKYYWNYDESDRLSYKKRGAYGIADSVLGKCKSVEEYYKKQYNDGDFNKRSWYNYFYTFFASLMDKGTKGVSENSKYLGVFEFMPVTKQIIVGGAGYAMGKYDIMAYLGTHDPANYYALTRCIINNSSIISTSSDLRLELSAKYPYEEKLKKSKSLSNSKSGETENYNENDAEVIVSFLEQDQNDEKLEWDKNNIQTWSGIKWTNGRITEIDISGKDLTGEFDVSNLSDLKTINISNNRITDLNIGECPIEELSCEGNLLDLSDDSDLKKKIASLDKGGNFVCSCYPQGLNSDFEFDPSEVLSLKKLANTDSNLSKLGWDVEKPASFHGITWELIDGKYHATNIDLSEKELSGNISLAGFTKLKNVSFVGNNLSGLDISDCINLKNINVSDNNLTNLNYTNDKSIESLFCDNNNITGDSYQDLIKLESDEKVLVRIRPQYIQESSSAFNKEDLDNIKNVTKDLDINIDWDKPGNNSIFQWSKLGDKYRLIGLDLSNQNVAGKVDLSVFEKLEDFSLENTKVEEVKLPQSVTYIEDRAFAECNNLKDLYVCDTWNGMGTDVFKECSNLTIHCIRYSFAHFISDALGFGFDEEVALDYIVIEGDSARTNYYGEEFSLNDSKLMAYYTDETKKEITGGYTVDNYDNSRIGDQTILITYSEGDYTRELEYDITVYGKTTDGFVYLYNGNEVTITDYVGGSKVVSVPEQIDGKKVTLLKEESFSGKDIEKITIPSSIKTIGARAFKDCDSLKEVIIQEGTTSIENNAFEHCTSLNELIMPDSIQNLGEYIFADCTSLVKVKLNDKRVNITRGTFYNCSSLKEVIIPNTVEYVRAYAFYNCSSLDKIDLPESIKLIESRAFYNCSSLSSFYFNDGLEEIGDYAFGNCSSLTKAILPDSITSLGCNVFEECISLEEARLNDGRKNITSGLFYGCSNLKKIFIPESVQYIRSSAFYGCSSIEELVLPESLELIEYNAFKDAKINKLVFDGTTKEWASIEISSSGNDLLSKKDIYCSGDGKYIYASSNKTSKKSNTSKIRKVSMPSGSFVRRIVAKKKALKVTWMMVSGINGYKIQYAKRKSFNGAKNRVIKNGTTTSVTIKKLKRKKKYYVRVRTYRVVSGIIYQSVWSKAKKKKTK